MVFRPPSPRVSAFVINLAEDLQHAAKPGGDISQPDLQMYQEFWATLNRRLGFYRGDSFEMTSDAREAYKKCEHWLKVLEALYGPKDMPS